MSKELSESLKVFSQYLHSLPPSIIQNIFNKFDISILAKVSLKLHWYDKFTVKTNLSKREILDYDWALNNQSTMELKDIDIEKLIVKFIDEMKMNVDYKNDYHNEQQIKSKEEAKNIIRDKVLVLINNNLEYTSIINFFVNLTICCRCFGLLFIEDILETVKEDKLLSIHIGLLSVLKGNSNDQVKNDILKSISINSLDDYIRFKLILEGILSIQMGESPEQVIAILCKIISENTIQE